VSGPSLASTDNVTKFGRKLFNSSLISILPRLLNKLTLSCQIPNDGKALRAFGFLDVLKEFDRVCSAEFRTRFGLVCCHIERLAQALPRRRPGTDESRAVRPNSEES
jgi:hypothetical protein